MVIKNYRNEEFLRDNFLTAENVLDYFALSPYYDTSCNNEVLKLQTQFSLFDFSEKLKEMKGKYYELGSVNENKNLFIILYKDTENVRVLKSYYVLNGDIYECPTNVELYENKVCTILEQLSEDIDKYIEAKASGENLNKDKMLELDGEEDFMCKVMKNSLNK